MFASARTVSRVGVAFLVAALMACGSAGNGDAGNTTGGNNTGSNDTAGNNTGGNNPAGNTAGTNTSAATASAYCTTAIGAMQDKMGACDKASDAAIRYLKQLASCASYDKEVAGGRASYDAT